MPIDAAMTGPDWTRLVQPKMLFFPLSLRSCVEFVWRYFKDWYDGLKEGVRCRCLENMKIFSENSK